MREARLLVDRDGNVAEANAAVAAAVESRTFTTQQRARAGDPPRPDGR